MFKSMLSVFTVAILLTVAGRTKFQDFNTVNAAFNQPLNLQMQATSDKIVNANLRAPHVQQQYRVYQQQGGQLNFQDYCFRFAETGGMSQEGTQRALQVSSQIHDQNLNDDSRYFNGSRTLQLQIFDWRNNVQDRWARQRGENLTAQSTYVEGASGSSWQLPNNVSAGKTFFDQGSGMMFLMDRQGKYWMNQGQGWQSMTYQQVGVVC